jgi:RNA polymerase sigma factor CnrH
LPLERAALDALAAQAQSGDRAAFAALLRALGPKLIAVVRAQAIPESDLDDVLQEAALRLWRNLADYRPDLAFAAWAVTVAANVARDWRRRRKVRAFWFGAAPLEDAAHLAFEHESPDLAGQIALQTAIADLPDSLRLPLLLTAVAGLTHAEAGRELGLTAKAVELRVARAKNTLRSG